ncbi:MmcQ/YjbR family DNA-binding protein [Pedobacter sp. HMF7647]|uniref:MmcQ/YjbR family DNA-binding protein n=1 Tax=Hufsiella arboris TaxID=2695275 RepID=A0A7K1Y9D9_9SPHI|nr:MmcQ/YjbR family DNA-binding protein [Hufsiella arboris]MXV50658.1 MmcQ/YjbR family DNA-binding protein [Hufsiella arboris]
MNIEELREYCISKKEVEETFPFGPDHIVFKVAGKMFLLAPLDTPLTMNVKCDPELAQELRDQYGEVKPGYHMNKKLWNTVDLNGSLPASKIIEFIDHSYDQVVAGLPKAVKSRLI